MRFLAFDYLGAKEDYDLALKLYPNDIHLRDEYVNYLMEQELFDEALFHVDSLITEDPEPGNELLKKAVILMRMKQGDDAIKALESAEEELGITAATADVRGLIYFSQGELGSAVDQFTLAIELEPDFAIAYQNRSMHIAHWER